MDARERFHATYEYGAPDRAFLMPQGIYNETRNRWLKEGMPADEHMHTYFGYDRLASILIKPAAIPSTGPPDVSFENYAYYMKLVHEVCDFAR